MYVIVFSSRMLYIFFAKVTLSYCMLHVFFADRPKPSTLLFYSVSHQTILLVKGEPLGGKGLIKRLLIISELNSHRTVTTIQYMHPLCYNSLSHPKTFRKNINTTWGEVPVLMPRPPHHPLFLQRLVQFIAFLFVCCDLLL